VSPDETHREVKRLEDERLRLASEVMGGNAEAIEKDRRLEERIREIARGGGERSGIA
jgi:general stress protein YciG